MNVFISMIVLLVSLLSFSCKSECPECDAGYSVIHSYSKKVKKQSWTPYVVGGSFDQKIKKLSVKYALYGEKLSLDKVRVLLVDGVKGFLNEINHNQRAISYLSHYPFSYEDIDFGLVFFNREGGFVANGFIAYVSLIDGNVSYSVLNEETSYLKDFYEESYATALKTVEKD